MYAILCFVLSFLHNMSPQYKQETADIRKQLDEDAARTRELSEQIQSLLTQRHPAPFTVSDTVRNQINIAAHDVVSDQLSPHLGENFRSLRSMIADRDERMMQLLWKQLEPVVELVDRLTQWVDVEVAAQQVKR